MEIFLGLFVGLVIGTTGIGGGALATPLLILLMGFTPEESVGASLIFSFVVKVNAAMLYVWRRQVDLGVLTRLFAGGIPGAICGSLLLKWVAIPHSDHWLLAALGAFIVASAIFTLQSTTKRAMLNRPNAIPPFSFLIGSLVGFSSVGAGVLGTMLLFSATSLAPAAVVGTDLMYGLGISLVSGGLHLIIGNAIHNVVVLRFALGGLAGASAGSFVGGILQSRILRNLVLFWAAGLGGVLVYQGLMK